MTVPIRVLFLEDRPDDARLLAHELRRAGFEPSGGRAETEAEFVSLLDPPPDVILSDFSLPQWSGLDALRLVRARGLDVPVIIVSGTMGEERAVAAMREGVADYLLKDRLARLGPAVASAVERRRLLQEKQRAEDEGRLLAAIVQSSDDAIIGKTLDGTITSWNPAAERLYGWTAEEAVGRPISLIVPPDRRDELAGIMDRLRRGERVRHHETVRVRRDGSRVDVSLTISPVRDASGRLVGVSKIARDVTERKRWEEAVRASEARFRALVENSWDGVTLLDADGVIRYASPATTRVLGYAPEECVGRHGAEFVHPDDLPAAAEVLAGVASAPGRSAILSYRYRHKNGSWLRVETAATNLLDDPHVRAVVLNSRDVTEALAADEALRRSEEQHRALAESIPNLVWVYRPDGTAEYFNRRWTEYTGVGTQDLAAGTRSEIVHPDDRPRMQEVWERALRDGHLYEIEYRLRRADGAYRWHIGRAVPVRDPEDRVVRWFGTCTDIHDGRRAEDERSRLARHIRLLLESTGEGIYGLDHEGHCTFINRAGAAMLGYTPEELLGREMHSIIHHHRPGGAPYPTDECPIYTAFREDRGVRVEDESFWRKDGTTFPVSYTSYPAAEGGFRGAVVTFQDVTERKRAEEEREKFVALVEHSADFIAMADLDSRLLYVNPGGRRMVGLDPAAEVRGHRIDEFVPPDVAALYRETVIPQALAGAPWVGEARFTQFKTGQLLDMQQCVFVVRKPGGREPLCLATVARDVTGAKRLEEQYRQAQKMEAVGQLAGGIAHDFNNLLTIINGYSDLLLQSLPPADPSRALLAEIHRAGERSAGLTRQLLAFSRRQVLAPRVLDLNAVVADTEKMLRRVIGEDVRLAIAPGHGLWPVRADSGQVEQVLLNLAVNARDAMPTGGRLTIETRNVELDDEYARAHPGARPGPHILLAASDSGCGMTPEVKARIFEPFFTTKGPGKGTGLGLATVYGIVTQSGGHIGVDSEAGVGTTFKVYLPRADGPVGGSKVRAGALAPPRGAETVLLVEDDPGVRALTRHILAGCGYTVVEAGDGDEAARAAVRHAGPIHLLVTDVVMPGQGGRAVAERLLERHPGLKVLYVSGYTDDAVVRHGVLHEAVNFLQKPFSPVALAHKVREVLDKVG
ncbi:MAG: Blue-light-activated protein [Gemmataceae bacterium]|nr:Blue-light-activated protein [Gemmataceae bacterium]